MEYAIGILIGIVVLIALFAYGHEKDMDGY